MTQKIAISAPLHNFVGLGLSLQLRHISIIGKKNLSINTSTTCPRNVVNISPLTAETGSVPEFGAPLQISMGFASWQRYSTALQQWASSKLCGVEQRTPHSAGRPSRCALAHILVSSSSMQSWDMIPERNFTNFGNMILPQCVGLSLSLTKFFRVYGKQAYNASFICVVWWLLLNREK